MDGNLNSISLPESWQEFSFSYTVSQTSELPVFKIDGEEITGTTYNIESGTIAEVTFEISSPDVSVYYSWTPTTGTAVENVKYEVPVEITGGGTFSYYAEQNGVRYAANTLTLTEVKTLTIEDFTITPEPGKYAEWNGEPIVIAEKEEEFYLTVTREVMTITDPSGEKHSVKAKFSASARFQISFDVASIFTEPGIYTVDVDISNTTFTQQGKKYSIAPMTFSYEIGEEETSTIPDGITVTPEPGAQEAVPVITFCAKGAPGFSNLMIASLSGNYITVTSPSGESRNVNLYGDAENTASGNFYADPGFSEPGEWTVTTHFATVQYMDGNLNTVSLPELWHEFSFSYTVSQTSALPVFKIDGEEITGTAYNIESGTIAEVTFDISSPDVSVYYSWTPTTGTAVENVKYEAPVEITGGGTFSYYAEQNGVRFAANTLTVTEVKTLRMEDLTITPEPGKYAEWNGEPIVIAEKEEEFYLAVTKEVMTITDPSGEKHSVKAKFSASARYQISFDVASIFTEPGIYTVDVNIPNTFTQQGNKYCIAPMTFSYEIDVETGIGKINADSEDAEYYDLTGRRVRGELLPGIYIVRDQDKTYKRIIK